jgi:hypothetical protein
MHYVQKMTFGVQMVEKDPLQPSGPPQMSLVEIGPRFVLTPIRIFEGAFNGATVYSNPGAIFPCVSLIIDSTRSSRVRLTICCTSSGATGQGH